ncbi:MAG: MBL fold metallo-hydrolase [Acidobacteria bacterium]|nr:MBL fold metallo-hydrolase [Acidobacteriota bacterium]
MNFKQFYLGCLAHASYYIGSGDEAAIIDPQRDVDQYIDEAAANGQSIKYVIETHSHADFVSGHIELAAKTGAEIVYGRQAETQFSALKVTDGDELRIGEVKLRILETPGHTPEGITVVAIDEDDPNAPSKVFTGDTLFIGDVGRPDLTGSKGFTSEQMAEMLYESLQNKIMPLPDDSEIYPAHGAGSLCGKSLSKETWSTLGNQKKFNYALQPMPRAEFVTLVTAEQPEAPAYFPKSAERNLAGPQALDNLPAPRRLSDEEVREFDGVFIDVRNASDYGSGHIPNSINIGLSGQFASWAGILISIGTPLAIVAAERGQVDEAVVRLARVGHETVVGFRLIDDYADPRKKTSQISVSAAAAGVSEGRTQFIDVRNIGEYSSVHAAGALNLPLDKLAGWLDKLDRERPTYVICQGGYRSSAATSILENAGFHTLYNITGGTKAWIDFGLRTEQSIPAQAAS